MKRRIQDVIHTLRKGSSWFAAGASIQIAISLSLALSLRLSVCVCVDLYTCVNFNIFLLELPF